MTREVRPLVLALSLRPAEMDGLQRAWRGDRHLAAVVGIGPAAAGRATARILDSAVVDRVLVVGVAGAVDPSLRIGDVLVPEQVVDRASGTAYRPHRPGGRGTLVTGDAVGGALTTNVAVVELPTADLPPGTSAVDMETGAIARVCEARGIPWSVVRTISDVPGTLDDAVLELVRPDGGLDPRAVARYLARTPGAARRLLRIGRDTHRAVRALTRAALQEL
ncbi:MAG: hypothetical protein ACRDYZ_15430 [Acidimicrobiales bacterium]